MSIFHPPLKKPALPPPPVGSAYPSVHRPFLWKHVCPFDSVLEWTESKGFQQSYVGEKNEGECREKSRWRKNEPGEIEQAKNRAWSINGHSLSHIWVILEHTWALYILAHTHWIVCPSFPKPFSPRISQRNPKLFYTPRLTYFFGRTT